MPTVKVELTSDWVLLVPTAKNFIIDNGSSYVAEVTFANSLPAVDAPCHKLAAGYGLVRMGVTGAVYGRDSQDDGPNREAWIAVSTEA